MANFDKVCYKTNRFYSFQVNVVSFADVQMCDVRAVTACSKLSLCSMILGYSAKKTYMEYVEPPSYTYVVSNDACSSCDSYFSCFKVPIQ